MMVAEAAFRVAMVADRGIAVVADKGIAVVAMVAVVDRPCYILSSFMSQYEEYHLYHTRCVNKHMFK